MIREIPEYGWEIPGLKTITGALTGLVKPAVTATKDLVTMMFPGTPVKVVADSVVPGGIFSTLFAPSKSTAPTDLEQQYAKTMQAAQQEAAMKQAEMETLYKIMALQTAAQKEETEGVGGFIEKYKTPLLLGAAGLGLIALLRN